MRRTVLKISVTAALLGALPGFAADDSGASYGRDRFGDGL